MFQTLPPDTEAGEYSQVGKVAGFSLHTGVATKANERKKLERICRYIARPAVSEKRLALTQSGMVRYQLKTPYRDGSINTYFHYSTKYQSRNTRHHPAFGHP